MSAAGTEVVGGRPCQKFVGVAKSTYQTSGRVVNVRGTSVWIDAESLLVRKVFEDTPEGGAAGYANQVTTTFEPQVNPVLDDSRFHFTPPSGRGGFE